MFICIICVWCYNKIAGHNKVEKNTAFVKRDTIHFVTQIKPLLQKNCSPCHFPGGKLYEKLPFDKDETIITHNEGVLKRFKNVDERKLIKQFAEQTLTMTSNR